MLSLINPTAVQPDVDVEFREQPFNECFTPSWTAADGQLLSNMLNIPVQQMVIPTWAAVQPHSLSAKECKESTLADALLTSLSITLCPKQNIYFTTP
jgi:hypothetical protein